MGDKMALTMGERIPVVDVGGEINFFCGPKGSLMLLVKVPDLGVLYGKERVTISGMCCENGGDIRGGRDDGLVLDGTIRVVARVVAAGLGEVRDGDVFRGVLVTGFRRLQLGLPGRSDAV